MDFAIGFLSATILMFALLLLAMNREWDKRRKIENKVEELYRHLACGQGFVGCKGGPNCNWDHK